MIVRFCAPIDFFLAELAQLLFEPVKSVSIKTPCAKELPREGSLADPALLAVMQLPAFYV